MYNHIWSNPRFNSTSEFTFCIKCKVKAANLNFSAFSNSEYSSQYLIDLFNKDYPCNISDDEYDIKEIIE